MKSAFISLYYGKKKTEKHLLYPEFLPMLAIATELASIQVEKATR